jgi:hypothetical protein
MIVSDIYDDAAEVLGFLNQEKVFRRLTDAIEALANKGSWEPLMAYVVIATTSGHYVSLPDVVEVPLRVTIEGNPSFSRGRMYEFTMNGPGPNAERVDWSWEDLGETRTITAQTDGTVNTDASQRKRKIRLSQSGVAVRMLVRLRTSKVTSLSDFIPLHSKLSILMMLKALESYRRGSPQDFQLAQGQEAQALKFLSEEQSSRNTFQDLANAMDQPSVIGYTYHSNNMVVVADIYDEAAAISGGIGKSHVFDAISEAVECLSNKGQWDGMTGYLDMVIPNTDVVGLPWQVEIPIKINIETHPTITRSRMFEFTVNGPGTNWGELTSLTWQDNGSDPLLLQIVTPSTLSFTALRAADAGTKIGVTGTDTQNRFQTADYIIPNQSPYTVSGPAVWKTLTRISKPETQSNIQAFTSQGFAATFFPHETEPMYRQIRLSKKASAIKVMFRRSSLRVSSVDDVIPLKSRSAILNMMRSLKFYKIQDLTPDKLQMAQALEQNALKYLQEEEQSRLAYIQASAKDSLPALGANYNSRGVVTAQDVYDDAADIFGPIGRQRLFDKITESMEMLANKSVWDGLDGYIDIRADQRGYISLPRKVEIPIGMNYCRTPTQMRSRWYEFHMNGMGSEDMAGSSSCGGGYWDDVGEYPIINETVTPMKLFAITSFSEDAAIKIRAYGYDSNGTWIRSKESGVYVDGERVPVTVRTNASQVINIPVTSHEFNMVSRVTKENSHMQMELWGGLSNYNPQQFTSPPVSDPTAPVTPTFLAVYDAEETEPIFRRMRVPKWVTWIRMRYRTSTIKITKMSDVLNMRSKTALVTMMRSLKALEAGTLDVSQGYEQAAVKLISEEQMSRNPAETFTTQYDTRTCFADPLQGQY